MDEVANVVRTNLDEFTVLDDLPPGIEVGEAGEAVATLLLRNNGYRDFITIKNASDNGTDIIARGPDGQIAVFEVKSTGVGKIGDLSPKQRDLEYVTDILKEITESGSTGNFIPKLRRQTVSQETFENARVIQDALS